MILRIHACVLACLFTVPAGAALAAPPHDHVAHRSDPAAPVTTPARRWPADADLRKGMGQVREALDDLRHHEMGHMPASMAVERAGSIGKAVDYMLSHCKLAPDADAALHGILVPLLGAVRRLEEDPADMAAITAMRNAVAGYPLQFDDPQWNQPGDAH